jgi:hypothetical protein
LPKCRQGSGVPLLVLEFYKENASWQDVVFFKQAIYGVIAVPAEAVSCRALVMCHGHFRVGNFISPKTMKKSIKRSSAFLQPHGGVRKSMYEMLR